MKQDNLHVGESLQGLINGVHKMADVVGSTMGTAGKNVLIETIESPGTAPSNDGAYIIAHTLFADPIEEMGRKALDGAVGRANKASGDGSSTTSVVTAAILEEGVKHLGEATVMDIKNQLESCIPIIEKSINDQKKEITVDNVKDVASISAEDEMVGERIQEIYQEIGKDGIIQWDISSTPEDYYTIGTGLTINDAGYIHPIMCDQDSREARLIDVPVLLMRQKIGSALEFESLFPQLMERGDKQIIIFCDEIELSAIIDLIKTQRIQGFRSVVVKMPVLWRDEWWEDLSVASGGKIVDKASGINLQNATTAILGKFGRVTVRRGEVIIEGMQNLTSHIAELQAEGTDQSRLRASRLNLRTARYFVGAYSEQALFHRRLKIEDALNAASMALEHGVVAGGGIALLKSGHDLPSGIGADILRRALEEPFRKIMENAGVAEAELSFDGKTGYDSSTKKKVDMFEAGIVDPAEVIVNAVKSAISVAASILTCGAIITLPREEETVSPKMPVMR